MERDPPDPAAFRAAIEAFLKERLNAKLDKLADDDPERAALATKHHPSLWITDAAARSGHVKLATHVAKATHPKAKGSSLYRPPSSLVRRKEVGTHAIGQAFVSDAAVDDAKHLDVYSFLRIQVHDRSLLDYALADSEELKVALSDVTSDASGLMESLKSIAGQSSRLASSTLAKQIYWLVGGNPVDDGPPCQAPLRPLLL